MKIRNLLTTLSIILLASCTLAPKYKTPTTPVTLQTSANPSKTKITTIPWKEFFKSPELQNIIQLALDNNRDLKIANLKIEAAQETHNVTRANLLPNISAIGSKTQQGVPSAFAAFTPKTQYRANLSLASYELDFFGRLRSLKKSALEDFLATKEAKNIIEISLIAETANTYAQFLSDSKILEIAALAVEAHQQKYNFTNSKYNNGVASKLDFLYAKTLLEKAKMNKANYEKIVSKDKSTLMLLTGVFDEKLLPLQASLDDIEINENLLEFLPSDTLLSRPDIKQAEHKLKGANANIGAARAAFFPSISLTGSYGYGSQDFSNLFNSKTWSFTPQINLPIFSGGRGFANLNISHIRKKIEIANYEKAIQTAFKEVLDHLATRQIIENNLKSSENIFKAQENYYKLSKLKYEVGTSAADNMLNDNLLLLSAQQDFTDIRKEYIANLINLYKVLGGGSEVVE